VEATTLAGPAPLAAEDDAGEPDGPAAEPVEQAAALSATTAASATRRFMSVLFN
jgi:hypothetical protein